MAQMRMFCWTAATAVCMALVSLAAAVVSVGQIERLARNGVSETFLSVGETWVEVRADGLQVILSGTAPDDDARRRAQRLAGIAVDSAVVVDEMGVAAAKGVEPPRFAVEFLRNGEEISVIGVAPKALDRMGLAAKIARIANGGEVKELLESADYPAPPGWMRALDYSLEALRLLPPRSRIAVRSGGVEITAISDDLQKKRLLEAELAKMAPDEIDLMLDISVPRPVIAPFTLRFLIDAGEGRFDTCSAPSERESKRIAAAAAEAGLKGEAICRVGLGAPSPKWSDAAVAGIRAVGRLGGGSVTFSDADITLVGPAEVQQALFDQVAGELDAALSGLFSLTAVKSDPVTVIDAGDERPSAQPEFVATLSSEGALQLSGRITDNGLREAVEGFSRALFSSADVQPVMRLDPELPNGWVNRVFAGLESLSLLLDGNLVVRPESVGISGSSHDPNASAEISRILSETLGAAETFAIEVSYVEPEEPASDLPTPEECIGRFSAILDMEKIGFEPGSAEIRRGSFETIDRIAEAMHGCSDVEMEIGGHTDSQGREEMNLQLSQARAESVLLALQLRRVLTGNLTPVGYGETRPVADNGTEEGREANRRIEFTLVASRESAENGGEDNEPN